MTINDNIIEYNKLKYFRTQLFLKLKIFLYEITFLEYFEKFRRPVFDASFMSKDVCGF